jgi:hypothetical protein
MGFSVTCVRRAVRSCEALAMMSCCESSSKDEEETRQSEVMGAGCAGMLAVRFLERSNARRWPSYEAVRKYLKKGLDVFVSMILIQEKRVVKEDL